MQIPEDIQQHLNGIDQAVGELVFLREVLDSIKEEKPGLVAFHAQRIAEKHNILVSTFRV